MAQSRPSALTHLCPKTSLTDRLLLAHNRLTTFLVSDSFAFRELFNMYYNNKPPYSIKLNQIKSNQIKSNQIKKDKA
ncbi:MAG: hypothetical protein ACPGVW_11910 [Pseudoalteromonas marina]